MTIFTRTYALARRVGVVEKPWFREVFARAYFVYKRWIEDPFARLCAREPELFRGGDVLDVGANIGYDACLFARAIEPGRRVHAFEPEPKNFELLELMLRRHHVADRVLAVRAAAGAADGTAALELNPDHHGDHKLSARGTLPVVVRSVDSYWAELGRPRIAFVKIDVQGHEMEVCRGMTGLLDAGKPHVAFEHDDSRGDEILRFFRARGYQLSTLARRHGYADLLARRPA